MQQTPEFRAAALTLEFYEANAREYTCNTEGMADMEWLERFSSQLPPGSTVLDVGCAGGRDVEWFHSKGCTTVGLDVSPTMIGIAKERVPTAELVVGDIVNTNFDTSQFDGVWCSCVLLHLTKRSMAVAVREVARILRPHGIAYFLVKEGDREGIEEDARYGGAQKYASYFSVEEMRGALTANNFEVIDSEDMHRQVDEYRATDRLFYLARMVG